MISKNLSYLFAIIFTILGLTYSFSASMLNPTENSNSTLNIRDDSVDSNSGLEKVGSLEASTSKGRGFIQEEQISAAAGGCKIGGCNSELCLPDNDTSTISSCGKTEMSQCYSGKECKVQNDGKCGWTMTDELNSCLVSASFPTEKLRVLEIRYFPVSEDEYVYHPDDLSAQLQQLLEDSSRYHNYETPSTKPTLDIEIVEVINKVGLRPNPTNYWYDSYARMIADEGLCDKVEDLDLDQIWMWVDPRDGVDPAPGLEYVVSSNYLQLNTLDAGYAKPAFCNGRKSFVIMGLDTSRTADLALHSYGHYMEGIISTLQTAELFNNRYVSPMQSDPPGRRACGDVHFPPNGTLDYDYENLTVTPTYCEDWNPNGTGEVKNYNCTRWGCTGEGYFKWWMQNFPGYYKALTYQSKIIPPWWDFVVNFDQKVEEYYANNQYFIDRPFLEVNKENNTGCSCYDPGNGDTDPVIINQCWETYFDASDGFGVCAQCQKQGWAVVNQDFCRW